MLPLRHCGRLKSGNYCLSLSNCSVRATVFPFAAAAVPVCRRYSSELSNLQSSFVHVMQRLPQPVVVVTAPIASNEKHVTGLTASSFASLSLRPEPLVMFNIRQPSATDSNIERSGRFIAHILGDSSKHPDYARAMAKVDGHAKNWQTLMDEIEWTHSAEGVPHIRDAVGLLHCEVQRSMQLADHRLWVGKVVQAKFGDAACAPGLVYYNRQFWPLAGVPLTIGPESNTVSSASHEVEIKITGDVTNSTQNQT